MQQLKKYQKRKHKPGAIVRPVPGLLAKKRNITEYLAKKGGKSAEKSKQEATSGGERNKGKTKAKKVNSKPKVKKGPKTGDVKDSKPKTSKVSKARGFKKGKGGKQKQANKKEP